MDNCRYHKDCERIDSEGNHGDHVFTIKTMRKYILKVIVGNSLYHKDYKGIDSEGNCGDHVFTIKTIRE